MFIKEPSEDLLQAVFGHPWIHIFKIFDCEVHNSSSLEVVDRFNHECWGAIVSIQKCHSEKLGLIRCLM